MLFSQKIISIYTESCSSLSSIDKLVLPLFCSIPVPDSNYSFSDARNKILFWVHRYLDQSQLPDFESSELSDLTLSYFDAISKHQLYSYSRDEDLQKLLIQLSTLLSPSHSNGLDVSSERVLVPFLSSLQDRRCFDQHRDTIRRILIFSLLTLFDPSIAKIVEFLFIRMDEQIKQVLNFWDQNVFKGFVDNQSTHSQHFVYLLLDDLFGIAGGAYKYEDDLLLSRSALSRFVCYFSFKDKLSLEHLFSNGVSNWKSYFSSFLSSNHNSVPSSIRLTLEDLLNSPKFLSYLKSQNVLLPFQFELLKQSSYSYSLEDHQFSFSWLHYSDSLDAPEITFTDFFVDLLFRYIHESLSSFSSDTFLSCYDISSYSFKDRSIINKLVFQYFLGIESKSYFSLDEILHALNSPCCGDLYFRPFIKPLVRLITLMVAHSDPADASHLFHNIIWPNRMHSWVFDSLLIMLSLNPGCIELFPVDKLIRFQYADQRKDSFITILHQLAKKNPIAFKRFILVQPFSISNLLSLKNKCGSTPFHLLSKYNPDVFLDIIHERPDIISKLKFCTNNFGSTPFHILALSNPTYFIDFISSYPGMIDVIQSFHNNDGHTPLHFFSNKFPSEFLNLTIKFPEIISSCSLSKDNSGDTPFHDLFMVHPKIFVAHLKSYIDNWQALFFIKNNEGLVPFHLLVTRNPSLFVDLINSVPEIVPDLNFYVNLDGESLFHLLASNDYAQFVRIFHSNPLLFKCMLTFLNHSFETPFHTFSLKHPTEFSDFISLFSDNFRSVSSCVIHSGVTFLDYLIKIKDYKR